MFHVTRTEEEIEDLRASANEQTERGKTKFPGASYEEGVSNTLLWLAGDLEESPMEEE